MPHTVTGSPIGPFGDAVLNELLADGNLTAMVGTRIVASLKRTVKTPRPYITAGRRDMLTDDFKSAMQLEGGKAVIWLDFWSDANGPHEVQTMMSHARRCLHRNNLTVHGFTLVGGSLHCEEEHV